MSSRKNSMTDAGEPGYALGRMLCSSAARVCGRPRARVGWWPAVLGSVLCGLVAQPALAQQAAPAAQAASPQAAPAQTASSPDAPAAQGEPAPAVGSVEACLAAHLSGQELRQSSKLLESREQFRQCARQDCPGAIARDCVEWLGQYERRIPSVTVRVTADGAGRTDARVMLDGVPVENTNGKAIELNPGEHVVRVELPPFEPYEAPLLISEGDQFRVVEAAFATPPKPGLSGQPAPARAEPVVMERPIPTMAYVFGVVSLAAAANGAGWALSSWSLRQELEKACAPGCRPESVDVLKQRAIIADVSWGVSVASLIASVTLYALRPEVPTERPIAFGLDVLPGGAVGSVSVSAF